MSLLVVTGPPGSGKSTVAALDYVVLLPEVEACVERVMTRVGHGFRDESAARKMHGEFARAEIDSRHVLVNDTTEEAAVDEILARGDRGELRFGAK